MKNYFQQRYFHHQEYILLSYLIASLVFSDAEFLISKLVVHFILFAAKYENHLW